MVWRLLLGLSALAASGMASDCHELTICELLGPHLGAFVGEVISGGVEDLPLRADPYKLPAHIMRVRVVENLRGLPPGRTTVEVEVPSMSDLCTGGRVYRQGKRYLFLNQWLHPGRPLTWDGRDLDSLRDFDLSVLREYFAAGQLVTQVRGRVAAARHDWGLVDFLLRFGEAKPTAGVVVSALSREGKRYSARTDSEGRYVLPLPSGGRYTMRAALPPYEGEAPVQKIVPTAGCSLQDFAMHIDNTLSGRVLDARGEPIAGAKVGLIDLDRPWTHVAYTSDANQPGKTFLFRNVPLGRYLLLANPEGVEPKPGLHFESRYFPSAPTRREARVIEIRGSGQHRTGLDIHAGPPVRLRSVRATARFPDDEVREAAWIEVEAMPRGADDIAWKRGRSLHRDGDGWVDFQAPANRKLRISVRDTYGRKMKAETVSLHEPGDAPITVRFTIKP